MSIICQITEQSINVTIQGGGGGSSTPQHASDVIFEPYKEITSENVQEAIEQLYEKTPETNSQYVDQSGGTSDTYGVLSGVIDGNNTTFTVSQGSYMQGTLKIYVNGQLQTQGTNEDWTETTPASGIFDFNTAPLTGDEITVIYGVGNVAIPVIADDETVINKVWSSSKINQEFINKTTSNVVINSIADFPVPINVTDLPITFDGATNEVQHAYGAGVFADGQAIEFVGGSLPPEISLRTIYYAYSNDADSFLLSATPPSVVVIPVSFSNGSGDARVAGEIVLENKRYTLNNFIFTPYKFSIPDGFNVVFSSNNPLTDNLIYTGIETFFNGSNIGSLLFTFMVTASPFGQYFDLGTSSPTNICLFDNSVFTNIASFGDLDTLSVYQHACVWSDIGLGANFSNNGVVVLETSDMFGWKNTSPTSMINLDGTIGRVQLNDNFYQSNTDTSILNIKKSLITSGVSLSGCVYDKSTFGGDFYKERDQSDKFVNAFGNVGLSDSTTKAKISITNNSLVTTISTINTPTEINTLWQDGSIEERMFFQDECTFDNTTDTISTAFNHGMSDGDLVYFHTISGTLPSEINELAYYVKNATTNTFQIEETIGGGVVDFTDDGTGTNYIRHQTGNNKGWLVYTGLEDVSVRIGGGVIMNNVDSALITVSTYIMKVAADGTITADTKGFPSTVSGTVTTTSIVEAILNLSTDEGIKIYVQNESNTSDLIVKNARLTFTKA